MPVDISFVIPLYNEAESLVELGAKVRKKCRSMKLNYEIIFIDDGSTDDSFKQLLLIKKSDAQIKIIRLRKRTGKSTALAEGLRHIRGKTVVMMDADLQDDPDEVSKLISKMSEGYQLVCGWRKTRSDESGKILLSRIFNRIVSRVTGIKLHDFNIGFKVMTADVARELTLYGEMHRFIPVLAVDRGFKVSEVEIKHYPRKYGKSKFGLKRTFHAAFDLMVTLFLISFKQQPMQLFGASGLFLVSVAMILFIYLSILHFMGESIGSRPLLTLAVILFLSGVQLVSTGLIAELVTNFSQAQHSIPVKEVIE